METLKKYIGERTELVFVTRNNKAVPLIQLAKTFAKAGQLAKVPFKVTPHVLKASTVTYLKQIGFSDSDIILIPVESCNFGCAKASGFNDQKWVHMSSIWTHL